jgi:hypothetical protein
MTSTTAETADRPGSHAVSPAGSPVGSSAGDRPPGSGKWGSRPYDLVKEFVIALVVAGLLTVGLAAVFSSPDERSVSLAAWARANSSDFVTTAASELAGTSTSAGYGPPYNNAGNGQKLGPLSLQRWAGVHSRVDPANDFVVNPLRGIPSDPELQAALAQWDAATPDQQTKWASAYSDALSKAPDNDPAKVAPGDYGPVPLMVSRLLALAQDGGLDGVLLGRSGFYQVNNTKPLLFLADGTYLASLAQAQHLLGNQWGIMNETGRFPGQAWLWLYTFWYQISPFKTSGNADALVWGVMLVLTLLFIFFPFIPGLRKIPEKIPVYRLVWRDWYRSQERGPHQE